MVFTPRISLILNHVRLQLVDDLFVTQDDGNNGEVELKKQHVRAICLLSFRRFAFVNSSAAQNVFA